MGRNLGRARNPNFRTHLTRESQQNAVLPQGSKRNDHSSRTTRPYFYRGIAMPLATYLRGRTYWVKGRVEYEGNPITDYYRQSTGALTEQGAEDWCKAERGRRIKQHLFGDVPGSLTFSEAVMLHNPRPYDVPLLLKVLDHIGDRPIGEITPKEIRDLGPVIYPMTSTDTWHRNVISPIRVVINNAHDLGKGPMIRVRPYTEAERIRQDVHRGKQSRVERTPSDRAWIDAFCAHADPHNAALARFMFETAARIGQAIAVLPDHVDAIGARVWIPAAKGHPAQWVKVSIAMAEELASLPPKQPVNRKTGEKLPARVFGYASRGGYRKSWNTICKAAGIVRLGAHEAGRHGFYTELRVRQKVDPITAAKMGRWKDPTLPDRVYGHSEANEAEVRELFRTKSVQKKIKKSNKRLKHKGK
jgi:integrase